MTNMLCILLNDINAEKIVGVYLFRWEESKIIRRKYLHNNKGNKIWIPGDLQNMLSKDMGHDLKH